MKCVLLNYLFMFEPSKTWQHRYQFESDFNKFLSQKGMYAEVMSYAEGADGPRIIKIEVEDEPIQKGIAKSESPKDSITRLKGK